MKFMSLLVLATSLFLASCAHHGNHAECCKTKEQCDAKKEQCDAKKEQCKSKDGKDCKKDEKKEEAKY
jgi:hypothetical protein